MIGGEIQKPNETTPDVEQKTIQEQKNSNIEDNQDQSQGIDPLRDAVAGITGDTGTTVEYFKDKDKSISNSQ